MNAIIALLAIISSIISANAAVTEKEFQDVSREFVKFIVPFGQRWNPSYNRSIKLVTDPQFGAFASEPITVNTGLINDRSMSKDGLALVLCHEVGHNVDLARFALGGTLVYGFGHLEQDYFAVHACLFPYFHSTADIFPGVVTEPEQIPRTLFTRCQSFGSEEGIRDCQRAIRAAQKLTDGVYEYFQRQLPSGNLPRPSFSREWLGPRDELQARLLNFVNGIFGDAPFARKTSAPVSAHPI